MASRPSAPNRGPRRRRPAKLHGDKGYDYPHLRRWLSLRQIRHRIARKGIESSQRLGRHRWVVERTVCATRRSVCIPGISGRNSEGGSWADDLPGAERQKETIACQETSDRAQLSETVHWAARAI